MANLFELLTNAGNKIKSAGNTLYEKLKPSKTDVFEEYAKNMQPLQVQIEELPPIQLEGGPSIYTANLDDVKTPENSSVLSGLQNKFKQKKQSFGDILYDALRGKRAAPTDSIDTTGDDGGTYNITTSQNPRVGGLLNDISAGYNENRNNAFNLNNFGNNDIDFNRKKGIAYRLGEGAGSLARIIESPLGRGLLTAGIVGATGGNGLEALVYGGQAGVTNQAARSADTAYRNQLKNDYGYSDEDLRQIKGYISHDTFNDLTKSQNSAVNTILKQQTTQSMNKLRELQAKKLEIQNSTLPEMQKQELLKKTAEAMHAEEMQLAKIKFYENSVANPLGWANYNLRKDEAEAKIEAEKEKAEQEKRMREYLDELLEGKKEGNNNSNNQNGVTSF